MQNLAQIQGALRGKAYARAFAGMYGEDGGGALPRYERLAVSFHQRFGSTSGLRFYSAPGRTEILGNHTDHNKGCVLAAAVTLDNVAAAAPTDDGIMTVVSEGYGVFTVDTRQLAPVPAEEGTTPAILRGIAARLAELGKPIGGFCAVVESTVASGSGLSSSASFEVLIVSILCDLYAGCMPGSEMAKTAQYAENRFFGKPCGLMDQTASAMGGLVFIDFGPDEPDIVSLSYDFAGAGYHVVVVSPGGSHDHLTPEYAAIPGEMKAVASALGGSVLRDATPEALMAAMPTLRGAVPDRALLRAMHFYDENRRVADAAAALRADDLPRFFAQVNASGDSSWALLQNVYVGGSLDQPLALALALAKRLLGGEGACRVHGGGFAGTILAFVPDARLNAFVQAMNAAFGPDACQALGIRPASAGRVV